MPYIDQASRFALEERGPVTAGELNYCITQLVDRYLQAHKVSYVTINEAIGALECAKLELYRRVVADYEDNKIRVNGDVYHAV